MLTSMNKHTHDPPTTTKTSKTVESGSGEPSAKPFGGNLLTCTNAGTPLRFPLHVPEIRGT
jgi:hypothetical protein